MSHIIHQLVGNCTHLFSRFKARLPRPEVPGLRSPLGQNVSLTPSWAAKGMPTVVPGPKKSPRAPAGTSSCLPLVTGTEHIGSGQSAVTFARLSVGTGRALISPT